MRVVLGLVLVALLSAGCAGFASEPQGASPVLPTVQTPGIPTLPLPTLTWPEPAFDGEEAVHLVHDQVYRADGSPRYRIPGTEGNNETAAWISDTLRAHDFTVAWHHFNATYGCAPTPMHNVIGERAGTTGRVIVLAAHYDTRPIADKDPDASRREEPILGANDGASGVAVLLELARVLPPTNDTLRLVFFDGEDGGGYKGRECTDWILGSRAYAASLSKEEHQAIRAFVLVDMVGDPELQIPKEGYSRDGPGRPVLDQIFDTAHRLGHPQFVDRNGFSILDDHVPFIEAGVPAVDLIHTLPLNPKVFPGWHHTHDDDMDVVSADSLAAVGRTVEAWVVALDRGVLQL